MRQVDVLIDLSLLGLDRLQTSLNLDVVSLDDCSSRLAATIRRDILMMILHTWRDETTDVKVLPQLRFVRCIETGRHSLKRVSTQRACEMNTTTIGCCE